MSGPAIGSPAYNNQSIGWRLITTDYVTLSIALILVAARLYTKYFLTKSPGWEDVMSVIALLLAIARSACDSLGVSRYYQGRHFTSIPKSAYVPFIALVVADGLLYVTAVTFAKLAILIFMYRIFKIVPKFRYTAWTIGVIMTLWALITVLLVIFSCRPIVAAFDVSVRMRPTTVCPISAPKAEVVFGFCNIFVDFMLLVMPMPLLWTLHMNKAKKIGVSIVFANGAVICAIAIIRQYELYTPTGKDYSWGLISDKIWISIEVNLAIICGCLPVLQPLFRKIRLLAPFLPSYLRSKFSSGRSAMEKRSWPQKLTGPRGHQVHDVEKGPSLTRNAPWREPDESRSCDSSGSTVSMYNLERQQEQQQQQQDPVIRSALEPAVINLDRYGTGGNAKGFAM